MNEKTYHLGAKALISNHSGQILLLKVDQQKFKGPQSDNYWDIPGGRVLNGQTIEETLLREIEEEIGTADLTLISPLDTIISNIEIPLDDGRKAGLILTIYHCTIDEEATIILSPEHSEYIWSLPGEAALLLSHKYPTAFTRKVEQWRSSS